MDNKINQTTGETVTDGAKNVGILFVDPIGALKSAKSSIKAKINDGRPSMGNDGTLIWKLFGDK